LKKIEKTQVVPLYLASLQYLVTDLEKWCISKLESLLQKENVFDFLEQIEKLNANSLKLSVFSFIAENKSLLKEKRFQDLDIEDINEIFLRISKLN